MQTENLENSKKSVVTNMIMVQGSMTRNCKVERSCPMADMSQNNTPYAYCVNNPILFIDKYGLDTGRVHQMSEVNIVARKYVQQIMEVALYGSRPFPLPRYTFWQPNRTDYAKSFDDMAYNAIVTYSSKTIITGNLLEKLKKDAAFLAWRKKVLMDYKRNPLINRQRTVVKFGGEKFFSFDGDFEVKQSVRNAVVEVSITESNQSISLDFHLTDTFDLNYQKGRGMVYNGINGILKGAWVGVLDGNPDMGVESNWNEKLKK